MLGIYLHHGYINPALTMPVMLCVLAGSLWRRADVGANERAAAAFSVAILPARKLFTRALRETCKMAEHPGIPDPATSGSKALLAACCESV